MRGGGRKNVVRAIRGDEKKGNKQTKRGLGEEDEGKRGSRCWLSKKKRRGAGDWCGGVARELHIRNGSTVKGAAKNMVPEAALVWRLEKKSNNGSEQM